MFATIHYKPPVRVLTFNLDMGVPPNALTLFRACARAKHTQCSHFETSICPLSRCNVTKTPVCISRNDTTAAATTTRNAFTGEPTTGAASDDDGERFLFVFFPIPFFKKRVGAGGDEGKVDKERCTHVGAITYLLQLRGQQSAADCSCPRLIRSL